MSKTVFLFSGQGAQYTGMGVELAGLSPAAKQVFECAGDIVGFDVEKICADASEETLAETEISQPCIMAVSLAALACANEKGIQAQAYAGHSLGEYAAMVESGIVTMEDGFRLIKARARAMNNCAKYSKGAMFAVMGADDEAIFEACESVNGYVLPVNFNSNGQTVIAGEEEAVTQAAEKLSGAGRKTIRLAVSAAFHSKMMEPAAQELKEAASSIAFKEPSFDFYSNVTGEKYTDFTNMPDYTAKHMVSPVLFVKEMKTLEQDGYTAFIELGPKKTLTSFVKKTLKGVTALNVEDNKSLEKAMAKLTV